MAGKFITRGGDTMQNIHVIADGDKVKIIIDGVTFSNLHSFSLDYVNGCPLLFSCVADIGKQKQTSTLLH